MPATGRSAAFRDGVGRRCWWVPKVLPLRPPPPANPLLSAFAGRQSTHCPRSALRAARPVGDAPCIPRAGFTVGNGWAAVASRNVSQVGGLTADCAARWMPSSPCRRVLPRDSATAWRTRLRVCRVRPAWRGVAADRCASDCRRQCVRKATVRGAGCRSRRVAPRHVPALKSLHAPCSCLPPVLSGAGLPPGCHAAGGCTPRAAGAITSR